MIESLLAEWQRADRHGICVVALRDFRELRERTTNFAAEVVRFCKTLRRQPDARGIAEQLSALGTSVAANYRAVTRARSRREFISKLAVTVEEADETVGSRCWSVLAQ